MADAGTNQVPLQTNALNNQKITEAAQAGKVTAQDEQKNSHLFDADKIRSLGIKNLHTSKREEKSKRKLQRKQSMFDSVQLQNSSILKNLEMQPQATESDRYQKL